MGRWFKFTTQSVEKYVVDGEERTDNDMDSRERLKKVRADLPGGDFIIP